MKTLLILLLTSIPSFINAQNLIKSKTTDNWYVGVNMGWSAKYNGNCVGYYHNEEPGTTRNLDDYNLMKNLNMNMGLRIGSHLTPTFGLGLDISGSFGNKPDPSFDRAIKEIIIAPFLDVNLTNWFLGYQGTPRSFEVSSIADLAWANIPLPGNDDDFVTSKIGFDLSYNFGKDKQWQAYVEPATVWILNGYGESQVHFNKNRMQLQLKIGINYKFKNSNGTHNFKYAD